MKNFFLWGWVLLFDPEILKSGTFQSPNQSKQQGWLHLLSPPFTRWEANQYNSRGIFLNHKFNKILVFLWNVNTRICNFVLKTITVENSQTIQQPILLKTSIQKRSTEWPWKLERNSQLNWIGTKIIWTGYPWRRSKRTHLASATASGTRCSNPQSWQKDWKYPRPTGGDLEATGSSLEANPNLTACAEATLREGEQILLERKRKPKIQEKKCLGVLKTQRESAVKILKLLWSLHLDKGNTSGKSKYWRCHTTWEHQPGLYFEFNFSLPAPCPSECPCFLCLKSVWKNYLTSVSKTRRSRLKFR